MIEAINLARNASEIYHQRNNGAAAAEPPAFVRRHSSGVQIKVPQLNFKLEEAPQPVLIDTDNVVNDIDEPTLPFCKKRQLCGHKCFGVENEKNCPPCLDSNCAPKFYKGGVNADELCGICYTSELGAEPSTKLSCGHIFHTGCIAQLLKHRWSDLRITWSFMSCPSCKHEIEMKELPREIACELGPLISLKQKCEKLALENAEKQGILKDPRVAEIGGDYYG